jgi:hypothetical protein
VDVEDVQGNRFALRKPVVLGNAAIIVIDKVLMSGERRGRGGQGWEGASMGCYRLRVAPELRV